MPCRTTWKPLPDRPEYPRPHEPDCRNRRTVPRPTRNVEIARLSWSTSARLHPHMDVSHLSMPSPAAVQANSADLLIDTRGGRWCSGSRERRSDPLCIRARGPRTPQAIRDVGGGRHAQGSRHRPRHHELGDRDRGRRAADGQRCAECGMKGARLSETPGMAGTRHRAAVGPRGRLKQFRAGISRGDGG